jgi:hypothetical protein
MRARALHSLAVAAIILCSLAWGCGGGSTPLNVSITISPASASVQVNMAQQFTATVTGTSNTAVSWSVNGIPGGNSTVGTITSTGLYTAPSNVPNPSTVSVTATAQADTTKSAIANVLIVAQGLPAKLGTSGGNQNDETISGNTITCCSGTLGGLVTRGGTQYILSNNHVLARSDQASLNENILQPGLVDTAPTCSASATTVAHLSQFARLCTNSGCTTTSNVDAAIAAVVSSMVVDSTGAILFLGSLNGNTIDPAPPASTTVSAAIGMGVAKSGRSTGLTCSSIQSISTNVHVDYQTACGSGSTFTVTFTNQVIISGGAFSASGDSGALIVNSQTAQPVALLFAGNSTSTTGNPIQDVLNALADPNPPGTVPTVVGGAQHSIACPTTPSAAVARAGALSEAAVALATAAKNKHAAELMADPAVIGVGVGASDDSSGEAAVVVYVERGKSHAPIPAEVDGVRTKVISTGRFQAQAAGTLRAQGPVSEAEVARATAVKTSQASRLMADPAVIGVGVGASDDSPGEAALVLYVEQGKTLGAIPAQINGVRTKIIRTDRFRAFDWNEKPTKACRPSPSLKRRP